MSRGTTPAGMVACALRSFARLLGFKRTGKTIDDSARSVINGLLRDGRLGSAGTQIRREL